MATRSESNTVYAAGLVQGVALVTFPAASTIFTSPSYYGLSSTQYGAMFLPQVVLAIAASLLGAELGRRFSIKRVYLAGLVANLVSMLLLITSQFFTSQQTIAYGLLLAATAALGLGFGLTVPALNSLTAVFHPAAVDRSVLTLNALLGLGTALAPVFVAMFVGLGFWWGLPVMSSVLLACLLLVSMRLPLRLDDTSTPTAASPGRAVARARSTLPSRFWLFAAVAVLYGICETMNGNWSETFMRSDLGATATEASLTLTTFWVMVTFGRLLFGLIQKAFPTRRTYHSLPFVLAGAFVLISLLPKGAVAGGFAAFAVAGLGCSALLPLTISLGQEQLAGVAAMATGGIIAFYQLGYGIAAFGAGPLLDTGASLSAIYGISAVFALALGVLSFAVARPHDELTHLHPRPSG
jgi:MFS family permease